MKIYEKLPKTNCKECGESSCHNFAVKLLTKEKNLHQCPYLNISEIEKMLYPIKL